MSLIEIQKINHFNPFYGVLGFWGFGVLGSTSSMQPFIRIGNNAKGNKKLKCKKGSNLDDIS